MYVKPALASYHKHCKYHANRPWQSPACPASPTSPASLAPLHPVSLKPPRNGSWLVGWVGAVGGVGWGGVRWGGCTCKSIQTKFKCKICVEHVWGQTDPTPSPVFSPAAIKAGQRNAKCRSVCLMCFSSVCLPTKLLGTRFISFWSILAGSSCHSSVFASATG